MLDLRSYRMFGPFRTLCLGTLLISNAVLLAMPAALLASLRDDVPGAATGAGWGVPGTDYSAVASLDADATTHFGTLRTFAGAGGCATRDSAPGLRARARCTPVSGAERARLDARPGLDAAKSGRDTTRSTTIPPPSS